MIVDVRLRWLLVGSLVAAGGCSFSTPASVVAPIDATDGPADGRDGPTDGPPADASPCRAVEVSAMSAHTCARMENGDVWCWGINHRGEVGRPVQTFCNPNVSCNPTPEKIVMPPATRLGVSEDHACAIAGAQVYCWGGDAEGQFGDGTGTDRAAPVLVAARAGATMISGGLTFGCSLHGAAVKCSGNNDNGEVGNGTTNPQPTPVTTVPSGTDAIATAYDHACAIEGGFVYCWGSDSSGQSSTSPGPDILSPTVVANVGGPTALATGYEHSCIAHAGGDLRCWGKNTNGQLGTGDILPHPGAVVQPQVSGIVELSAGVNHTCGRTPLGSVYCWGEDYAPTPAEVTLPSPAISIASGSYHDCFALMDGSVWCLGWNAYGQLGMGTHTGVITQSVSQVNLCP